MARNIHVSRSATSKDDPNCGPTYHPCFTIAHALNISQDSDRISLDTTFEHVAKCSLEITNAITISSYQTVLKRERAVLLQQSICYDIFKISKNSSFDGIEIVSKTAFWNVFHLVEQCQQLFIERCSIKALQVFEDTQKIITIDGNLTEVSIKDTDFIGQHRSPPTSRKNILKTELTVATKRETLLDEPISSVTLNRCSFINQSFSFALHKIKLFVENSVFIDSSVAVDFSTSNFKNNIFTKSSLFIYTKKSSLINCHFQSTYTNDIFFNYQLKIKSSSESRTTTNIENCTFEKAIYGAVNIQNSFTTIQNTNFIENTILKETMLTDRAGALTTISGTLNILDCQFINNSAPPSQTGSIYSKNDEYDPPRITFNIDNTAIVSGNYQGFSEGTVIVADAIFGKINATWSHVGKGTLIQCKTNEFLSKHAAPGHYFQFRCTKCDGTTYNTKYAWFKNHQFHNVTCYKCPHQASCVNGIKSKGNYWGSSDPKSGQVSFTLCPVSYCCSSLKKCFSYDTCSENREGPLCGDCKKNYSISLLSHNECVPRTECQTPVALWTMYIACAITACLFVLYAADAWFKNTTLMTTPTTMINKIMRIQLTDP